ncbi:MAG: hypothetical protein ABI855_12875 [Bacteroidota bacterium]
MKDDTLAIDEIILAVTSLPKLAKSLYGKGKDYETILTEILKYDSDAENSHMPSSKELQAKTKLNAQKCKKQIVDIYNDFLALMGSESVFHEIKNVTCEFNVSSFGKSKFFYMSLPVIPRIGEALHIQFLRPIFGVNVFYVEDVVHVFKDDCQLIEVHLKAGFENTYARFIKDKAKFENRYDYITGKIRT